VFRHSENPSVWLNDFDSYLEENYAQNTLKGPASPKTAATEQKLSSPTSPAGKESAAPVREKARQGVRPKFSPSFEWVDGIKRAASKWEWKSPARDRKSTRLNSSHEWISYAVFCLKKKKNKERTVHDRANGTPERADTTHRV